MENHGGGVFCWGCWVSRDFCRSCFAVSLRGMERARCRPVGDILFQVFCRMRIIFFSGIRFRKVGNSNWRKVRHRASSRIWTSPFFWLSSFFRLRFRTAWISGSSQPIWRRIFVAASAWNCFKSCRHLRYPFLVFGYWLRRFFQRRMCWQRLARRRAGDAFGCSFATQLATRWASISSCGWD